MLHTQVQVIVERAKKENIQPTGIGNGEFITETERKESLTNKARDDQKNRLNHNGHNHKVSTYPRRTVAASGTQ